MSASANPWWEGRRHRAGTRGSSAMKRSGSWIMRSASSSDTPSIGQSKSSTPTVPCTKRRRSYCCRKRRSRRRMLRRCVHRSARQKRPRRRRTSRSRPRTGRGMALTHPDHIHAIACKPRMWDACPAAETARFFTPAVPARWMAGGAPVWSKKDKTVEKTVSCPFPA